MINKSSAYSDPLWPRHLPGQLDTSVAFGEHYSPATVLSPSSSPPPWPPPSPPGGAAAPPPAATALATAAALAIFVLSARTASGWGIADGPVSAGHAPVRCTGTAPRVCMAETGGAVERLDDVRTEVTDSLEKLRAAGVDVTVPSTVTDGLLYRSSSRPRSTTSTWWLPLTAQAEAAGPDGRIEGVRYAVLLGSVTFPCSFPATITSDAPTAWIVNRDAAMLWAAYTVDAQDPYLRWRAGEYAQFANGPEVLAKVKERAAKGRSLPTAAQRTAWFEQEKAKACRQMPKRPAGGQATAGSQGRTRDLVVQGTPPHHGRPARPSRVHAARRRRPRRVRVPARTDHLRREPLFLMHLTPLIVTATLAHSLAQRLPEAEDLSVRPVQRYDVALALLTVAVAVSAAAVIGAVANSATAYEAARNTLFLTGLMLLGGAVHPQAATVTPVAWVFIAAFVGYRDFHRPWPWAVTLHPAGYLPTSFFCLAVFLCGLVASATPAAAPPPERPASPVTIELDAVSYAYGRRSRNILSGLSYTIPDGFTILLGPNGAGKTTTLKLAAG